jgi:hypothetical protein
VLLTRKHRLEQRLAANGIQEYSVEYLPYLQFSPTDFHSPQAVGRRLLILYTLSSVVHALDSRPALQRWLQQEGLWDQVSEQEIAFWQDPAPEPAELAAFSWHIEAALVLGWALQLVHTLPEATGQPASRP